MKSKNSNSIALLWVCVGIIIVTVGILLLLFFMTNKPAITTPVNEPSISEIPSSQEEPEIKQPTTARIIGVGDNLIHEGIYNQARKRAGGIGYDFAFAYEEIEQLIQQADIASINQETQLASIYEPSSYPMFNSPTQLGDQLVKIGFDLFNQANNHTIDKGTKGILSTLDYWQTKSDAKVTGVYRNESDYQKIRTIETNDIIFSFIGMTELTNGLNLPKDSDIVLMRTQDEQKIQERIEQAKANSDVVVINVHWGIEYTHTPNQTQKALAKKMIEWGADIIFGHHPHVIQPVEYIERADGTKGIVCYSLGNFISAQDRGPRMIGGMLDIIIEKNHETDIISFKSVSFVPVITHYGAGFSDIKVYPLQNYTKELANKHGVKSKTSDFSYEYIKKTVDNVIDKKFLTVYE